MVCALLPVSALAADTLTLSIVDQVGGQAKEVPMASSASGTGWSWSASNKTLTLNGFKGETIEANTDLKIVLKGANTMTLPSNATFGIKVDGTLTINKSSSSASDTLTISQKVAASSSNLIKTGGADKACTINGGTVTLTNNTVGGGSTGIYFKTSVNNDANLNITVPYRGIAATLTANTSGKINITTNGSDAYSAAVYGLSASGSGTVTLKASTPAVTVFNYLNIASTAGDVVLNGYTKVTSPLSNFKTASNKKVSGVDGYYQGYYTTDPAGNPGYYLTDSQGKPLSSATYKSVTDQPLTVMDSSIFDLSGLKVGTSVSTNVGLLNATRGGAGNYRYYLKSGSTLPAGLTVNETNGSISGTPTKACEAGSFVVVVKDNKGASGCNTAEVTINYSAVKAVNEYLTVNGKEVSVKEDASEIGWSYTAANKTLTLSNYNGGPIKCDTDLNIILNGINTVTLPGPSETGIKVNGKLTIDKKTTSAYDSLTVKQTVTTTSANLIVTGGTGESKACEINGGSVNLQTSEGSKSSVGIKYWAIVNNDANLTINASGYGISSKLNANTSGLVSVTTLGKRDDCAAVYSLNATGTGMVTLTAPKNASTVYNSINVSDKAGSVVLNGYTKVSSSPYQNIKLAANKTLQGTDSYYLGYSTTTEAGKGYYLTNSDGKPLASSVIITKSVPLTLMDSPLFDLNGMQVGTKLTSDMYPLNATRGGAGNYVYSVKYESQLPAGLTINEKTGLISGTPQEKDSDGGSFIIVVKDNGGAEGCSSAEITVNYGEIKVGKPSTPVITGTNNPDNGKCKITWKADSNVEKYVIYRATSSTGSFSKYDTIKGSNTSYTNTSTTVGSTYYYKIKAIGYDGTETAFSNTVNRTCDCARPVVTAGNNSTTGKVTLKWNAVDGAKEYAIYRATSVDGTYSKMYTTTSTSYTNTSAKAGTTYYYKVMALSSYSYADSAYSVVVSRACCCAAPVVTSGNSASSGKVTLKWAAVEGADKYEIWRATSSSGTYTKYYTTVYTSYTNTSSVAGKTYYYKVKAVSSANDDASSAFSSVVSRTCDCAAPVVSITLSSGHPKLSWTAVDGADKYVIYRSTSKDGTFSKYDTVSKTNYTNSSASAGTTYYYKVVAVSNLSTYADSAYSSVVSIKAQ